MSVSKKSKIFSRIRGFLIFIIIAGGVAFGGWRYYESLREPPLKFLTSPVERGDMRFVIMATGKVQPVSLVSVGTQISGTLKELYVDYNSVVKNGQLIAIIDPEPQEADLAQADAALLAASADVAEAEASLKNAIQNLARSRELFERDLIARSALESDETSLATARARLAASKARVEQQRANLRKANLQLGYTRIHSPVDGVVVTRNVDVGQTVAASFNTPTIAEIAEDLSRMQVEVNIDEADIGSVRETQKVEFNVDAFPDRSFNGTVSQIRLSPASENNVISYKAIVSFENEQVEGQNLIPGMTANVTLIVEEKNDVVMVPNAALRFRPISPQGAGSSGTAPDRARESGASGRREPSVYRIEGGEPSKMDVETGITDGANTEIISGVEPGVDVIVGIDVLSDS
ncbi:MAG: efflux RND transporter periplasmic adaptor subunit [Synergistaceae bacterium]|jgi:HlyD family secretion protein|nr:efflux RND transporter periplasmic adaptor subunit [Synergistaceae bacterium]